jgi:hypothetical protein
VQVTPLTLPCIPVHVHAAACGNVQPGGREFVVFVLRTTSLIDKLAKPRQLSVLSLNSAPSLGFKTTLSCRICHNSTVIIGLDPRLVQKQCSRYSLAAVVLHACCHAQSLPTQLNYHIVQHKSI